MADTENLVLEYLRATRADIAGLRQDVRDLVARVGDVERGLAQVRDVLAEQYGRMDRLTDKVERIEGRLDSITPDPDTSPQRSNRWPTQ